MQSSDIPAFPPLDGSISVLPGFVDFHAAHNPDRPFAVFPPSPDLSVSAVSFAEFAQATHRVARALQPDGHARSGEVVAILVNCDALLYVALIVGAVRAGLVVSETLCVMTISWLTHARHSRSPCRRGTPCPRSRTCSRKPAATGSSRSPPSPRSHTPCRPRSPASRTRWPCTTSRTSTRCTPRCAGAPRPTSRRTTRRARCTRRTTSCSTCTPPGPPGSRRLSRSAQCTSCRPAPRVRRLCPSCHLLSHIVTIVPSMRVRRARARHVLGVDGAPDVPHRGDVPAAVHAAHDGLRRRAVRAHGARAARRADAGERPRGVQGDRVQRRVGRADVCHGAWRGARRAASMADAVGRRGRTPPRTCGTWRVSRPSYVTLSCRPYAACLTLLDAGICWRTARKDDGRPARRRRREPRPHLRRHRIRRVDARLRRPRPLGRPARQDAGRLGVAVVPGPPRAAVGARGRRDV